MALEERTRPDEILFRFWPDGRVGGEFKTTTEIVKDGTVMAAQLADSVSISTPGFPSQGPTVDEVLSHVNVAALADADALRAQIATLNAKIAADAAVLTGQRTQTAYVEGQLSAAQAQIADLTAKLASTRHDLELANGKIVALSQPVPDPVPFVPPPAPAPASEAAPKADQKAAQPAGTP